MPEVVTVALLGAAWLLNNARLGFLEQRLKSHLYDPAHGSVKDADPRPRINGQLL